MATINSGVAGLHGATGWSDPPARAPRKEAKTVDLQERRCEGCECSVPLQAATRSRRIIGGDYVDGMCAHCAAFFGTSFLAGCTNDSPADVKRKLERLREDGFLMLLRDLSLTAKDGNIINLGAADIFPCVPTNPLPDPDGRPEKDHTWSLFTLQVQVGPYPVTLMPHEWSPIGLRAIMRCKSAGELTEAFVGADDRTGHFAPTPELRAQIVATFGRLINAGSKP
jgi:hypothetical protein